MNTATHIGTVPARSTFIRFASPDDLRAGLKRIALFQTPDGKQHWICHPQLKPFTVQVEVDEE